MKSARFNLPFLVPGQAQKELFHNEALQRLDFLVQAVAHLPSNEPPPLAPLGSMYIVGTDPVGDWAKYCNHVACMSDGGWMFLAPFDGMTVASPDGQTLSFKDGRWLIGVLKVSRLQIEGREMLGGPVPSLHEPEGGETIDLEARGTLNQIVRLLRAHGLAAV